MNTNWQNVAIASIGCHPGCTLVHLGNHAAEVNQCEDLWRLECSGCSTVLSIYRNRGQAMVAAVHHVLDPKTDRALRELPI